MLRYVLLSSLLTSVIGLGPAFECPGTANCTCSKGVVLSEYELLCPKTPLRQPSLIAQVRPEQISSNGMVDSYFQLQCNANTDWRELGLVAGLRVGRVNSFVLRLCPLPGVSFSKLMRSVGVPSTKNLQIQSHNNLSDTLTRHHLEGLRDLTNLHLNSNGLRKLPEDLLADTGELTWLDLRYNEVVLPRGIFRYVPKLEVLELGRNNLTTLEPGLFRNLTRLRLLNLWSNRLHNLTRAVFSDVPNLESLDLNSNGLVTLTPDLFADLSKLKNLNLFANDFYSLPQGLFLSTPLLEKFQIHNNRRSLRTLPSGLLANLTRLREAYLHSCNLTYLPEDLLWGSTSLVNLTLQRNLLTEVPAELLRDTKELQTLDLSFNRLTDISEATFSRLKKLVYLNLAHNKLTNLSGNVFSSLATLEILHLEHNQLRFISPQAFEPLVKLIRINLTQNNISTFSAGFEDPTFGQRSFLQGCKQLEEIFLARNNITELYADWTITMTSLRTLDLSHNQIQNLSTWDLQFTAPKLTVNLSYNKIKTIDLAEIEQLAPAIVHKDGVFGQNKATNFILKHNPIECNCQAYHLVKYFRGEIVPEVNYIINLDSEQLTCNSPAELKGISVKNLRLRMLTCEIEGPECPKGCRCDFRRDDLAYVINCSFQDLTELPLTLPVNNKTNHTELDFRNNKLKAIPTVLGSGYERVTKLYLSHNNISNINLTKFSPNLQLLELDGNNLTRLDSQSLKFMQDSKHLEWVTLHNNPWTCDCEVKPFLNFLHTSFKKVALLSNITCKGGGVISKLNSSELCPTSMIWGVASIVIAFLGLLIGGMAAVYYRYQREIKVWLYAHRFCLWFVTEEELDKDKLYDAFVSYSHQDEDFIVNNLVPGLENGPTKFKLCLHYRDWIVGDFIPNQIARSVEDSRRTIVVLSPNFLESVWGRMEFRAAHSQALSEGRARVIVILYGDIGPTENLDLELKAYLSMNTYVKWGDPWFWDKLRYALPHPPELTKSIPLVSRNSTKRAPNDKSVLMNGSDPNATPPAVVTPPANSVIIDPLTTLSNSKPV